MAEISLPAIPPLFPKTIAFRLSQEDFDELQPFFSLFGSQAAGLRWLLSQGQVKATIARAELLGGIAATCGLHAEPMLNGSYRPAEPPRPPG